MKVTVYSRAEIEKVMADGNFPQIPPSLVFTTLQ